MALRRCVVCNRLTAHAVTIRFPSHVTADRLSIPICATECAPGWSTDLARDTNPATTAGLTRYLGPLEEIGYATG